MEDRELKPPWLTRPLSFPLRDSQRLMLSERAIEGRGNAPREVLWRVARVATEERVAHAVETATALRDAPAVRFARLTLWLAFALIVALATFVVISVATFGVPSAGVASGPMGYAWVGLMLFSTGVVLFLIWLAAFGFPERI